MQTETTTGRELQVGDTLRTDWIGTRRIISLDTYVGPLAPLWNGEARIAKFDNGSGMTIEPNARFERVALSQA